MFKSEWLRSSLLAVLFMTACCAGQTAEASVVVVGPVTCKPTFTHFATIGAAITSVPPGSTVDVCPGTYPEQVVITKKLTLVGIATASEDAVVILPPATGLIKSTSDVRGDVAAQIFVQGTPGPVLISNLTVDGTGNLYSGGDLRGILYQDASGTVNHVAVRNEIPNDVPSGAQSGQGIFVETNTGTATLTVQNSSVHNYNKNGIVARYAGATLNAIGNYVQGSGPISYIAQNGIELAFGGAGGTIKNNTVIDNFYIPTDASSSDILLYDAKENGSIIVSSNTAGNSNIAIALVTVTPGTYGDGVTVTTNKIFGTSTFDGIDVCTNGNIITGNTIFNSAESGIHLDVSSCGGTVTGNNVSGNTILESACAGVLADSGTGSVGVNTFYTVPFPVTNSTASCPAPAGPVRGGSRKFQP